MLWQFQPMKHEALWFSLSLLLPVVPLISFRSSRAVCISIPLLISRTCRTLVTVCVCICVWVDVRIGRLASMSTLILVERCGHGGRDVSLRRTFMTDVRHQLAKDSESSPEWRFGFFGVVLLLPMARGAVSWAALPGSLLLAVGGVLGVGAQRSRDVAVSRRRG